MADCYTYTGIDSQQRHRTGTLHAESAADLARYLHQQGWQEADITHGKVLVGAVTRDGYGRRTWWGDKATVVPVSRRQRVRR